MNEPRAADWNLQRRIDLEVATRVAEALVQPLAAAKARLLVHEARGEDAVAARREYDRLCAALEQHIAQARLINEDLTGTPRLIAEGVSHLSAKLDHTRELQQRIDLVYAPAPAAPPPAHPAAPSATPQAPAAAAPADTAAPAPAPMTDPRDLGCRAVQAAAESGYLAQLRGMAGDDPARLEELVLGELLNKMRSAAPAGPELSQVREGIRAELLRLDEAGPAAAPATPAPIVRGRGARRRPPAPRRRSAAARPPAHHHPEAEISWEARGARTATTIRPLAKGMSQEDQVEVCMKVAVENLGRTLEDLPAADAADLRRGIIRGLSQRGAAPAPAPAPAPALAAGSNWRSQ